MQDNVHDFAWFADKRFNVKQEDVTLSNGQVVKAYVFADQTNLNYTDDIKTALITIPTIVVITRIATAPWLKAHLKQVVEWNIQ